MLILVIVEGLHHYREEHNNEEEDAQRCSLLVAKDKPPFESSRQRRATGTGRARRQQTRANKLLSDCGTLGSISFLRYFWVEINVSI